MLHELLEQLLVSFSAEYSSMASTSFLVATLIRDQSIWLFRKGENQIG
jgi:hypothetical protein